MVVVKISTRTQPEMPEAIIGNSRMLVSLRKNGEILRLFWPHIDYAQHLGRFWPGIKLGATLEDSFTRWFHLNVWDANQRYLENTNVLETTLTGVSNYMKVIQRDFVLPDHDVLVRFYEIQNTGEKLEKVSFLLYCNFEIEESLHYDSAYFEPDNQSLLFYRRNIYLAVAGAGYPLAGYHLGRRGTGSDPFQDASRGLLWGNSDNIRESAGSLAWDLGYLPPGQSRTFSFYLVAGHSKDEVMKKLTMATAKPVEKWLDETISYWRGWLGPRVQPCGDYAGYPTYKRSLLVIKLLISKDTGASIAAPEFDPHYLASGGYGYCWPRDSVYIAAAMDEAGYHDLAEQFYYFASSVQEKDGSWQQRYFTDGSPASTWGKQIDQVGSVMWGYRHHYRLTRNDSFLERIWPSLNAGAGYLSGNLQENGLPAPSYDLWEDLYAQATYSAASVYAGLQAAADLAEIKGRFVEMERWGQAAARVREGILKHQWSSLYNRFVRGVNRRTDRGSYEDARRKNARAFSGRDPTGLYETFWVDEDSRADAALLGLAFPFAVLDPLDERMQNTARLVEELLWNRHIGGLHRYEWDSYRGGNPWLITTLWLSIYHCMTGNHKRAKDLYEWAYRHANQHQLLPEQVDRNHGGPAWVMPLSWSHAMFILAHLALQGELSIITKGAAQI